VECLHRKAWYQKIEGVGFTVNTKSERRVIHRSVGFEALNDLESDCVVVVAPDLAPELRDFRIIPEDLRRILICVYLNDNSNHTGYWKKLVKRPFNCELAMELDGTRWAILELEMQ
jgi:hypothetical protein